MLARFQNINATKFSLNGIEFHKVFMAFKVNADYIRVINVYDSRFQLLGTTKFDQVEVNGNTYASAAELISNLSDVVFSKSALTQAETEQIEQNRQDIITLQQNSSGPGHNHDDRYYTESEINALELKLKKLDFKSHALDGELLKLYDGNTPANLIDTIDLGFFASQGTQLSTDAQNRIVLSNDSGEILSVLNLGYETRIKSIEDKFDPQSGEVLSQYLPAYVDDVIDGQLIDSITFNATDGNPVTPEGGKIYVDTTNNKNYRWSGSVFTQTNEGVVLGETAQTAYRGDRGKQAYEHSQTLGNPHNTTADQIPETTTRKWVSPTEKNIWNSKANDSEVVKTIETADGQILQMDANGKVILPDFSTQAGAEVHTEVTYTWNTGDSQIFTVADSAKTTDVYVNGDRLIKGVGEEWNVNTATGVEILVPLADGDKLAIVSSATAVQSGGLTPQQEQDIADSKEDVISYALSSPSADLTAGDTDSFIAPYNFTLNNYFAGVVEAPTGSALVIGLKKNGTSVTSSNAIIDSGETTSLTGTAPTITTNTFFKGDLITPVISQVGSLTTGKSLKIYLEITKS
jgi:hypothetical protein